MYEQQRQALMKAGVKEANFYQDVGSLSSKLRPNLHTCLETLTSSDTLVVWQLERLVDSRSELMKIFQTLVRRSAGLIVIAGKGAVINTSKVSLKTVIEFMDAWTELEEQLKSRAITKGLAASRSKGKKLGAEQKVTPEMLHQAIDAIKNSDVTVSSIATELSITRATLYKYVNGDGSLKALGLKLLQETD